MIATLGLVAAWAPGDVRGGTPEQSPPPQPSELPGQVRGRLDSRWVAPYVLTIGLNVGGKRGARTVWYAPDGGVVRDVLGAGDDCVVVQGKDGASTVHGVRAGWTIALPPAPPPPAKFEFMHLVSGDGRTFVRQQSSPADSSTTADVFVDGEFKGRAGPAVRWRGRPVRIGEDGSLAIEAGKRPGERGMRVLVFAPGAQATFEVPLGTEESVVQVAPAGKGVLLRRPKEGAADEWLFASAKALKPLDLGNNPDVLAWVPGTTQAIVASGAEDAPRLRLVDLESGATVWDVPDQPLRGRRRSPGVTVEGDLVLVSGLEATVVAGASRWRRRVDALERATGKPVATWRSTDAGPVGLAEPAVFRRAGDVLHLVTPEGFATVPVADIREKTNGWN